MSKSGSSGRHGARRLLLQALYQYQLAAHDVEELIEQFSARPEFTKVDIDYFRDVLRDVLERTQELDQLLDVNLDRPISQLDPIEHAVLWLGAAELSGQPEVPPLVIIDEAVELAKEFGGQDSYRYINAVLDKTAKQVRQ